MKTFLIVIAVLFVLSFMAFFISDDVCRSAGSGDFVCQLMRLLGAPADLIFNK